MIEQNLTELVYPLLDRYSGWGGGAKGAHNAGFYSLFSAEQDKHALACFRVNFPNHPIFKADVSLMSADETLELARVPEGKGFVYCTTTPCQGGSMAGARDVYNPLNQLMLNEPWFISQLKPTAFVFENVPGITQGKMKVLKTMLQDEIDQWLGDYDVYEIILDANDYGVAQHRKRYIQVGVLKSLNVKPFTPIEASYKPVIKDVLPEVEGLTFGYWDKNFRDASRPSPTVTKTESLKKVVKGEKVRLTIEDVLKLCGFPDDWKYVGSKNQVYQRAGNSVMPLFAEALFKMLYTILQEAGVEPCTREELEAVTAQTVPLSLKWVQNTNLGNQDVA
jgi:site-specific DNA-cytosine methylase